jgi:hypothetical protein
MRNPFTGAILALMTVLVCSSQARAQGAYRNTEFDKLNTGPGGPAPKHDLSGSWAGPVAIDREAMVPPMTPLGQKLMSANKPEPTFHISGTNDSYARVCDPLGFPRNMVFELRGIAFATMPDRIVVLNQYQRAWREIWMDGRELPKKVAPEKMRPIRDITDTRWAAGRGITRSLSRPRAWTTRPG